MTDSGPSPKAADPASGHHENRLNRAVGSSMLWNIANNLASNGVTLLIFVFLTYELDPTVFGLFALGVIIVDYFNLQARSACLDVAVMRRLYSKPEMDTIFWAMMGITVCVIILCVFVGSWMAKANDQPILAYLMPALALTLIPVPLSIPPNAQMLRDHDFKGGAIRSIVSVAVGGVAALLVVFSPFAEWALVAQRAVQVTVSAAIMMLRVRWWPGFHFSRPLATGFLRDAGRIFAAQAIGSSYMRVLDLVVAFGFGPAAVGLMRIASRFVDIVYGTFISPISSLWVVLLSEGTHAAKDRDMMYRRLSQISALVALPIFAGLALTSADVIAATLSPEYAPAASLLCVLCLVGLFSPLTYFRNAALTAVNRLNRLITYSVVDVIVVTAAAMALSSYSTEAIVASLLVMEAVRVALTVPVLLRDMHTRPLGLLSAVMPAYLGCLVMAAAVLLVGLATGGLNLWLRLGVEILTGAAAYTGFLLVFYREWSLTAINMLRPGNRASADPVVAAPAV